MWVMDLERSELLLAGALVAYAWAFVLRRSRLSVGTWVRRRLVAASLRMGRAAVLLPIVAFATGWACAALLGAVLSTLAAEPVTAALVPVAVGGVCAGTIWLLSAGGLASALSLAVCWAAFGPGGGAVWAVAVTFERERDVSPVLRGLAGAVDRLGAALVHAGRWIAAPAEPPSTPPSLRTSLAAAGVTGAVVALAYATTMAGSEFFANNDGIGYSWRAWAQLRAWLAGIIYPRWFADLWQGYGYPLPEFQPPLSRALPALLMLAGLSVGNALQISTAFAATLAGMGAAALFARRLGFGPALAGALAFALGPWVVQDAITRGALAEVLAFAAVPWAIWCAGLVLEERGAGAWLGMTLAVAGTILTHNIVASATVAGLTLWIIVATVRRDGSRAPAYAWASLGAAMLLSAPFWVPMLCERKYVCEWVLRRGIYDYSQHWIHARHWLGFTGETPAILPGSQNLYLGLGPVDAVAVLIGVLVAGRSLLSGVAPERSLRAPLLVFAGAAWMTSVWSAPLWRVTPFLWYYQMPLRWLLLVALGAGWLTAWVVAALRAGWLESWLPMSAGAIALVVSALGASTCLRSFWALPGASPYCLWWPLRLGIVVGLTAVATLATRRPGLRRWIAPAALALIVVAGVSGLRLRYVPAPAPPVGEASLPELWRWERDSSPGTTAGEYMPIWAQGAPSVPAGAVSARPPAEICVRGETGNRIEFEIISPRPVTLTYGALYFPGWVAEVDGQATPVHPDEHGLVSFALPAGRHRASVDFAETPLRRASWLLAGLGLAVVAWVVARR